MRKTLLIFGMLILLSPAAQAAQGIQIEKVKGDVQVLKSGSTAWVSAQNGMPLQPGDQVKTGAESTVEIMAGKGKVTLEENTQFGVKSHEETAEAINTSLELTLGQLKAKVEKLKTGSEFKVITPTSVAAVRGTHFYLWVYEYLGELFSRLGVGDGSVFFSDIDGDGEVEVGEGESSTGGEDGVTDPEEDDLQEEEENPLEEEEESIEDEYDSMKGFQQDTLGSQNNASGSPIDEPESDSGDKNQKGGKWY